MLLNKHKCRIGGSYGNSVFSFLKTHHSLSHSIYIFLHSVSIALKVSISPQAHRHFFLKIYIPISVRLYLIVVLICIPLIINTVEHIFMCCCSFVYLLWRNVDSNPLSTFKIMLFVFWCCLVFLIYSGY
jgi:hypothetical protein